MVKRREFQRAYRFRFYPTPEQENLLRRTLGCARLVYNKALEARSEAWTSERRNVSYSDTSSMLTGWKKTDELSFLNDVSCVPLQQALRHLQRAFSGFFKQENAYPVFKKKTHGGSAEFTRSAFNWNGRELRLAKMKEPLPIVWSRTLPKGAEPSTVTVSLDPAQRWHVSILVKERITTLRGKSNAIALDLGVDSFAVTDQGAVIENPRHLKKSLESLARAQRSLSRKRKGSNNHRKAQLKVARINARIADQRRDFLHKLSTNIIRDNQTVIIEDLAVRNMTRRCKPKNQSRASRPVPAQRPIREKRTEPQHTGRRMGRVPTYARIQERMVRTPTDRDRPVLSEHATVLHVRGQDRPQDARRQGMDMPCLRLPPRS